MFGLAQCAPARMVLGATLALGPGLGTGCQAERPAPQEVVAPPHAPEETGPTPLPEPAPPEDLDLTSEMGSDGDAPFRAHPGFSPDPLVRRGTTQGGPFEATRLDERCGGFIGARPDHVLQTEGTFAELLVMVASPVDSTLAVLTPSGDVFCGDDEDGAHPLLRFSAHPGRYRMWVGTRERDAHAPYVLALSELEDQRPSTLTP